MEHNVKTKTLTNARTVVLRSARFHPPSAWVVDTTGGRVGLERASWKKNVRWLAENGYLRESAFNDYYLTDQAEEYLRSVGEHPEKFLQ